MRRLFLFGQSALLALFLLSNLVATQNRWIQPPPVVTSHNWEVITAANVHQIILRGVLVHESYNYYQHVTGLAFSTDGTRLAALYDSHASVLWNVRTSEQQDLYSFDDCIAFSPDGRLLATAGGNAIHLWNARTGHFVLELYEGWNTNTLTKAVFSPDSTLLATIRSDASIWLWNMTTTQLHDIYRGSSAALTDAVFSPDGRTLVSSGEDGRITFWDVATGRQSREIRWRHSVEHLAFDPDGTLLAAIDGEGSVQLWDPARGTRTALRVTVPAYRVDFSPDGSLLVTGNSDRTLTFWNVATGEPIHVMDGSFQSLAFSPDGTTIATDGFDNVIRLWSVSDQVQV